jgi:hypothetical protein
MGAVSGRDLKTVATVKPGYIGTLGSSVGLQYIEVSDKAR